MDLEDRQIIRGSLDHDLASRLAVAPRPILGTEDRLDAAKVQRRARTVDDPVEQLFHLCAMTKKPVPAVFGLVHRVAALKPALLLFLQTTTEGQPGRRPTLATLAKAPYRGR